MFLDVRCSKVFKDFLRFYIGSKCFHKSLYI